MVKFLESCMSTIGAKNSEIRSDSILGTIQLT